MSNEPPVPDPRDPPVEQRATFCSFCDQESTLLVHNEQQWAWICIDCAMQVVRIIALRCIELEKETVELRKYKEEKEHRPLIHEVTDIGSKRRT